MGPTLKSLRTGRLCSFAKIKKRLLFPTDLPDNIIDHMRREFGISYPVPRPAWMAVQVECFTQQRRPVGAVQENQHEPCSGHAYRPDVPRHFPCLLLMCCLILPYYLLIF